MGYIELDVLNNEAGAPRVMGIDLGTTNSLAATFVDGRPQIIRPDGHSGRVPSVLHFSPDGQVLVGTKAREQAVVDPGHTIFSIKRLMGRGVKDVEGDLESFPFPVSEGEHGLLQVDVFGRKYTPQELSSLILMRVHDMACRTMSGAPTDDVVITVPAYFDDTQRQATRDAARLAGLNVLRIVNEPTAASLAYGLDRMDDGGHIVVYDLGGGTFDVSVLSIEEGVFRVLSTTGDTHLGGDDFDRVLVELVLEQLRGKVDDKELEDPALLQAARLAAERCKCELSEHHEADLHFVVPDRSISLHLTVTREEFESRLAPWIERTLDACRLALSDAGLEPGQIDEVVMVGGSTRIPAVRKRVEEYFGRLPHTELNPDEVVAIGAAIQAHVLSGGSRDLLLMDVIPLSLGLETMGGAIAKIVHRNSTVPCSVTEGFTTYADNQTGIDFNILQGERELAADNRSLGQFKLTGIPPMPAGLARVAVRFHVDADGLLTVTAREESTGARASIEVQPMNGLTDDQVEQMLAASLANAREDFDKSRAANLKIELGTMIRATEKTLPDARELLDVESLTDLEESLAAAKAAQELDEVHAIQKIRDEFERTTLPLAAVLMDGVAKAALSGRRLDEV